MVYIKKQLAVEACCQRLRLETDKVKKITLVFPVLAYLSSGTTRSRPGKIDGAAAGPVPLKYMSLLGFWSSRRELAISCLLASFAGRQESVPLA